MNPPQTPKSVVTPLRPRPGRKAPGDRSGILVSEEQLSFVHAQQLYRMRCECGRPWFEVQLPKLVTCPGCGKKGVVVP